MIKSMTGFGRCELSEGERKVSVEIKTVNHRYLDVAMKMPKKLNFFDSAIRTVLKEYLQRGKVDVFVTYEDLSESNVSLVYNQKVAEQYVKYFRQMEEQFGLENDMKVSVLARCPEVLVMEEQQEDEEEIWQLLEKAVRGACGMTAFIEERSPQIMAEYRQKLEAKVQDLLTDAQTDESRIAMEVTLFADKICVDEEIVRLRSHVEATKAALESGGSVGRKLDFIAQEMNREANTTLSKANDLEISNCAIDLKTEIEKVREQIQNIE